MQNKVFKGLDYTTVIDPAGLRAELERLLQQSRQDAAFAAKSHYVKWELGSQQSFIKIDMSEKPFQFWYCDLQERPVTKAVQHAIADFLWEKAGEKEKRMQALPEKNTFQKTDPGLGKSGFSFFNNIFQQPVKLDISAASLEVARQEFRDKLVRTFIADVNNPDMHNKAMQTIAEIQGDLFAEKDLLSRLMQAKRQPAPATRSFKL